MFICFWLTWDLLVWQAARARRFWRSSQSHVTKTHVQETRAPWTQVVLELVCQLWLRAAWKKLILFKWLILSTEVFKNWVFYWSSLCLNFSCFVFPKASNLRSKWTKLLQVQHSRTFFIHWRPKNSNRRSRLWETRSRTLLCNIQCQEMLTFKWLQFLLANSAVNCFSIKRFFIFRRLKILKQCKINSRNSIHQFIERIR